MIRAFCSSICLLLRRVARHDPRVGITGKPADMAPHRDRIMQHGNICTTRCARSGRRYSHYVHTPAPAFLRPSYHLLLLKGARKAIARIWRGLYLCIFSFSFRLQRTAHIRSWQRKMGRVVEENQTERENENGAGHGVGEQCWKPATRGRTSSENDHFIPLHVRSTCLPAKPSWMSLFGGRSPPRHQRPRPPTPRGPHLNQSAQAVVVHIALEAAVVAAGRAGAVGRLEDTQVDEPGAGVELGVDGVDEPGLVLVDRLEDDDAGDIARAHGRHPAQRHGVAVVPHVELEEGDRRLAALADLEGGTRGEGGDAKLVR